MMYGVASRPVTAPVRVSPTISRDLEPPAGTGVVALSAPPTTVGPAEDAVQPDVDVHVSTSSVVDVAGGTGAVRIVRFADRAHGFAVIVTK
jgi:hypothetical protein